MAVATATRRSAGTARSRTLRTRAFVYPVLSTIINSFLGTFLAFILLSHFPGKRVIRFLILLPWTIPIALTILSWKWMLDPQFSVINWVGSWKVPFGGQ